MAVIDKKPTKPFSRVKNHLAELQRWWPVHIKNDTKLGISVDPVLYRTKFGPDGTETTHDEASLAGIRVEAITDAGATVSGTEPTITISGSGTYNPRCTITHSDGTTTTWLLIAPTGERRSLTGTQWETDFNADNGKTTSIFTGEVAAAATSQINPDLGTESTTNIGDNTGMTMAQGPYPVFMTIQELCELIDTYKHIADLGDQNKPAWLPHGNGAFDGNAVTNRNATPPYDKRISPQSIALPALAETYRATVFMPMLLDNNQLAKGNDNNQRSLIGMAPYRNKNGISRYDQQPAAMAASGMKYKVVGNSGDHKLDLNEEGEDYPILSQQDGLCDNYKIRHYSPDSSVYGTPHYRMSQALACFLKDGTYSLTDGVLIPYVYDNNRYLGGTTTDTLYATWDGYRGYGDSKSGGGHTGGHADATTAYNKYKDDTPAGIFPFFDFVQGPLAPRGQGSNWRFNQTHGTDASSLGIWVRAYTWDADQNTRAILQGFTVGLGSGFTIPNTRPAKVVAAESNANTGEVNIFVYQGTNAGDDPFVKRFHIPIPRQVPIYIQGVDGALGVGESTTRYWPRGRYGSPYGGFPVSSVNGWFHTWGVKQYNDNPISSFVETETVASIAPDSLVAGLSTAHFGGDNSPRNFVQYRIHAPFHGSFSGITDAARYVVGDGATLQVGRIGGAQEGIGTYYTQDTTGATQPVQELTFIDEANQVALAANQVVSYNPFTKGSETGWLGGYNCGDLNVPAGGSSNDTMPARPTIAYTQQKKDGEYNSNWPVPRPIKTQTQDSANNFKFNSFPNTITKGGGILRIPAPLGHDICDRYNIISLVRDGGSASVGNPTLFTWQTTVQNQVDSCQKWIMRADKIRYTAKDDKWGSRGLGTPLWSYMDSATGAHAWDNVKPRNWQGVGPVWRYGRNRPWPVHERMGTRMAMTPSLQDHAITYGYLDGSPSQNFSKAGVATTLIGLSETGCSPIHLDIEMTASIPAQDNKLTIMEFDLGETDSKMGRHTLLTNIDDRDLGFGFKPQWDGKGTSGIYRFDDATDKDGTVVAMPTTPSGSYSGAYFPFPAIYEPYDTGNAVFGGSIVMATQGNTLSANQEMLGGGGGTSFNLPRYAPNQRAALWFMSANTHYSNTEQNWQHTEGNYSLGGTMGWGRMNTEFGKTTTFEQGLNVVRAAFHGGGMTVQLNGTTLGTDVGAQGPCWGFTLKSCALMTFPNRRPFCVSSGKGGGTYLQNGTDEPRTYARTQGSTTTNTFGYGEERDFDNGTWGTLTSHDNMFPKLRPIAPDKLLNNISKMTTEGAPVLNVNMEDLMVDEMVLRHIPTPAMLPFTVDTTTLVAPILAARYTSLAVEADNIDLTKKMNITATLLEIPTHPTNESQIAREATVPIAGFEDIDLQFLGGYGTADLTGLPATNVANGFVVRFNFYTPTSDDADLMPIDWTATPTIRSWSLYYDHKPTSDVAVVGNTFDGSTATTVGTSGTQAVNGKVGHILSLTAYGDTTDPDRTIEQVKVYFGDGTDSGWLVQSVPAMNVSTNIAHVYSNMPSGGVNYFDITVVSKDDVGNLSVSSDAIRVTMTQAEPVAVLRAIPSMVRAGQAIRFDGADSYTIDTTASINQYTWQFGDGSTSVTGFAKYQDHTYAGAGEYMATLVVTDSTGAVSPLAKVVVKILPATLIVPLTLNTKPSAFSRSRSAQMTRTPVLDAIYPEVSDSGMRGDTFTLTGSFLKATQNQDIEFMEELLLSGALVEFDWQEVNYQGVADTKTFVGRLVSFDYNRRGGDVDQTPYTATLVREAGLDA